MMFLVGYSWAATGAAASRPRTAAATRRIKFPPVIPLCDLLLIVDNPLQGRKRLNVKMLPIPELFEQSLALYQKGDYAGAARALKEVMARDPAGFEEAAAYHVKSVPS